MWVRGVVRRGTQIRTLTVVQVILHSAYLVFMSIGGVFSLFLCQV